MKTGTFKSVMVVTAVTCVAVGFSLSRSRAEDGPPPTLQPGQQAQLVDAETGLPESAAEFQDGDTIAADTPVYSIGSTSNEFSRDNNTDSSIGDGPFVLYTKSGLSIHIDPFTGGIQVDCDDCAWARIEGTIQQESAGTLILRFRLIDGIVAITIPINQSRADTYEVSIALAREGAEPILSTIDIPERILENVIVDVGVSMDRRGSAPTMADSSLFDAFSMPGGGEVRWLPFAGAIFTEFVSVIGCTAAVAACQNDTLTAQRFCHGTCSTEGCSDCCANLASDDLTNCYLCGTNGPDGDYGNCTAY